MRIDKALAVPVRGGYFNEDLEAITAGAVRDGFVFTGAPVSPGFDRINEPSEAVSIVLLLDNGQAVTGDAMSVEYSAAAGRRGRFRSQDQLPHIERVCEFLEGLDVTRFLGLCDQLEGQNFGAELHRPAVMYGVSQALLQAVAIERRQTAAEVVAEELGLALPDRMIPIYVQCGEDRHAGVDRMVLKGADAMPHGLINDIDAKVGRNGELLADYVSWVVSRIKRFGGDGYQPELHFDVYGMIGKIFDHDVARIADYLVELERRSDQYQLCIETPVLMESRAAQIEMFTALREALSHRGSNVQLIVDEWANNLEDIRLFVSARAAHMINVKSPDLGSIAHAAQAVLDCWDGGVRPILGGSCTDTDQSARVVSHIALATRPAWVLARPGMGVDEGLEIVHNEMARTLAIIKATQSATAPV
jgi:methylaspartate ammonia-lyase